MSDNDLRCPGCSSFNKESSPGCIFKDLEKEIGEDNITCGTCGRSISSSYIKENTDEKGYVECRGCKSKVKV